MVLRLPSPRSPLAAFARYLASYLLVLIIPLFFSTLSYVQTARTLDREARADDLRLFAQRASLLEQRFSEVEEFIGHLMADRRIAGLLDIESPYKNGTVIPELVEYRTALAPYGALSSLIATFQVYLQRSGVVITPQTIYISMPDFYGYFLRYGDHDATWWFDRVYASYHRKTVLPAEAVSFDPKAAPLRMIAVIQSLPLEAYVHQRGALVVFVSEAELRKHLATLTPKGGSAFILDGSGAVVAASGPVPDPATLEAARSATGTASRDVRIGSAQKVLSSAASSKYDWRYVAVTSPESIAERFGYVLRTTWLILLTATVVGIAGAFFVANRSRKPLTSLMAMLGRLPASMDPPGGTYLEYVQQGVRRILAEEEKLQRTIEERMPIVRAMLVHRLLEGEYPSIDEARAHLSQVGLEWVDGPVTALVARVCFDGCADGASLVPRLNVAKAALRQLLAAMPGYHGYLHEPSFHEIVVLLSRDAGDEEAFARAVGTFVLQAQEVLFGDGSGVVRVGVGEPAASALECKESYDGARTALSYRGRRSAAEAIWLRDIPGDGASPYTPAAGSRLAGCARAGDAAGAATVLAGLLSRPLGGERLSLDALRTLELGLRGTMEQVLAEVAPPGRDGEGMRDAAGAFDAATTVQETEAAARAFFARACDVVNGRKRSHNEHLRDAVLGYVNAHFHEYQLYLPTVATKFGISKEYLSRFFKEQTGVNFSVYVEDLRIRKSLDLLARSDTPVSEIAKQCGYSGIHAFRKAFRRIHGVAPSDYRDQHREPDVSRGPTQATDGPS